MHARSFKGETIYRRRMRLWSREIVLAVILTAAAAVFIFAALAQKDEDIAMREAGPPPGAKIAAHPK
jgi:hypothetical protein